MSAPTTSRAGMEVTAGIAEGEAAVPVVLPRDPQQLLIDVHGVPAMQGSKKHVGRGIMVEASKRTKPWRDNVRETARAAIAVDGWERLDGPVEIRLLFCFDRPAGHYRTGRNAHLLKTDAPLFPANRNSGDIDKMQRAVFDAITDAGAIRDDAQIVRVRAEKVWCEEHDQALRTPGVRIQVRAAGS